MASGSTRGVGIVFGLRSFQVTSENGTNGRAGTDRITIGELADRTGMSVRNIRAHQSRGLLAPPRVQGRTGYYDQGHVDRIELIRELQEEGFNLEAIRRIIADAVAGRGGTAFTLNLDHLVKLEEDPAFRAAYERATEPKRLVMIEGHHFVPYAGAAFDTAAAAACDWFTEWL